jgi:hypothetical protein
MFSLVSSGYIALMGCPRDSPRPQSMVYKWCELLGFRGSGRLIVE